MDKENILMRIQDCGIVAVVRAESADKAERIVDACMQGGVAAIELTFSVPHADRVIETLSYKYDPKDIILGAGTVMDAATARIAMLSGAQYIVSPYLDLETLRMCNRYRVPMMPGVMSVREAVTAMENGADILKIFPGDLFGTKIIKDILGNTLFDLQNETYAGQSWTQMREANIGTINKQIEYYNGLITSGNS